MVVSRSNGMRYLVPDPPAPGVHGGVGQVYAIARVGELVPGFRHDLDGQGNIVKLASCRQIHLPYWSG